MTEQLERLDPARDALPTRENPWLRYWRAQPGSALFLIAATIGCAIVLPMTGLFPEGFGALRAAAAGGFIGFGFGMLPIAHRIWD
jgi:hypothetical protein